MAIIDPENNKTKKIKVMLADDHPLLRQALKTVLEKQPDFEIVGEAVDGQEAINLASKLRPDVVIMDISMPKINGLDATRQIKLNNPEISILVLTVYDDYEHILSILQAGAGGYLTKSVSGEEVVHAIHSLISGETVLSPQVSQQVLKYASRYTSDTSSLKLTERLSPREVEILSLAARGLSNKDIAQKLSLSLRTVKGYLGDIFLKLDVKSRTEAVTSCLRKNIINIKDLE
jgi:two-component system, NarL family, response regulator LiaR